jgi:hypothetical protein
VAGRYCHPKDPKPLLPTQALALRKRNLARYRSRTTICSTAILFYFSAPSLLYGDTTISRSREIFGCSTASGLILARSMHPAVLFGMASRWNFPERFILANDHQAPDREVRRGYPSRRLTCEYIKTDGNDLGCVKTQKIEKSRMIFLRPAEIGLAGKCLYRHRRFGRTFLLSSSRVFEFHTAKTRSDRAMTDVSPTCSQNLF